MTSNSVSPASVPPSDDTDRHEPAQGAAASPAVHAMAGAIAAKLLGAWLANRRQTLMPHTLNFRTLAPDEVALVIDIMAAAAQADGGIDTTERQQAALALKLVDADAEEIAHHAAALETPQPLPAVLDAIHAAGIGTHAYAGALLAINRSLPANQAFLAYLVARLRLPPDLARALESRYRA